MSQQSFKEIKGKDLFVPISKCVYVCVCCLCVCQFGCHTETIKDTQSDDSKIEELNVILLQDVFGQT